MLKAQKDPAPWVVTANELTTGKVVFYDGSGFSENIADAHLYKDKEELNSALENVQLGNEVVDVFYFGVTNDSDRLVISRLRERIRKIGPTIGYGVTEHVSL